MVRIDAERPRLLRDVVEPWQVRDFEALDPAWRLLAGVPPAAGVPAAQPVYRRAWIERPRGHSKTTDMAVQLAWLLIAARRQVTGVAAAADLEQASLLLESLRGLSRINAHLFRDLEFRTQMVRHRETRSRLQLIASDVGSSWGLTPDFIICDELCHWSKHDLWDALISSAAKRSQCLLAVLSNAGVGRDWQWDARQAAQDSPGWHFSTLSGPQAPWISERDLAEQKRMLSRSQFERLWLNVWQDTVGDFVTLAEAEACRDPSLTIQDRGQPNGGYVAAIDYAEKHDYTAACICHRDGLRVVVDRMDIVVPTPERPTPVAWVKQWMERAARDFPGVAFVVDPYQLLSVIQELETVYDVRRFEFHGGRANEQMASLLQGLVTNRNVAWYPGCGQTGDADRRDDLETELANLRLRRTSAGQERFDHPQDGRHHDDRAFMLAAACLALHDGSAGPAFYHETPPVVRGEFGW